MSVHSATAQERVYTGVQTTKLPLLSATLEPGMSLLNAGLVAAHGIGLTICHIAFARQSVDGP